MQGVINFQRKPDYNRMVELLNYNSLTGIFTWKVNRANGAIKAGTVGGCKHNGYFVIFIDNIQYLAHRLAFYYIHKYWPENGIDHINKNSSDNRIINLREVSQTCNMRNSKQQENTYSGVKGVYWHKRACKWLSSIKNNSKDIHLGSYKSKTEAAFARYAGEQALGWKGCEANSPAYKYVCNILGK